MEWPKLSEGSLQVIMNGGDYTDPVMQILGSRVMNSRKDNPGGSERFRLLLSDGQSLISFAMLSKPLNAKIESGEIATFSIIKITKYITSVVNNAGSNDKRVLVILNMDLLVPGEQVGERIGKPDHLLEGENSTTAGNSTKNATSSSTSDYRPNFSSNGDANSSFNSQLTFPISSLTPYQNKWVIKARVMSKSAIRTWSNSKGEGKLFSMDLGDKSGEIRVTAFRDMVDKYYDIIEVDKVYYFSKCMLKPANKQFSQLNHEYEMTFTNDTIVQECNDVSDDVPKTQFSFIPIDKIANMEVGSFVDVIGVAKTTSDVATFNAKASGREFKKRDILLVDQSNAGISLTLWGTEAEKFNGDNQPIIAIKGAKVGEFGGGKNLSTLNSSILKINPDITDAHLIRGWFDKTGNQIDITNISAKTGAGGFQTNWMSFREVRNSGLGNSEKGDYYQVFATILLFQKSGEFIYKACPTPECNKKIIDMENGTYRCEKCNRDFPNFKYRLLASMNIGDWSGNTWVTVFASELEKILGMTSQEVGEAKEQDGDSIHKIMADASFKSYVFKCRAKMENYKDESRLKTVAVRVDPVNYKEYNAHLISRIQQLTGYNNPK